MSFGRRELAHDTASSSADILVPMIIERLDPGSVIDIGCGSGIWLRHFQRLGVGRVLGVDGHGELDLLSIPKEMHMSLDLSERCVFSERFDLALCLEVAEHLPERSADSLVETLTGVSDKVAFSAAIPFHGGVGHLNEQWPQYWAAKFKDHGYACFDMFRRDIWTDKRISPWYRQNIMVYIKEASVPRALQGQAVEAPLAAVHPDIYLSRLTSFAILAGLYIRKGISRLTRRMTNNVRRGFR